MEADCPYFGECGGCRLQHIAYVDQVEQKRAHLARLLDQDSVKVFTDKPFGYRNRVDMVFHDGGLGFRRAGSWDKIVDIDHCLIAEPRINLLLTELRQEFPSPDAFDVRHHTGTFRYAVMRVSREEASISFILNPDSPGRLTAESLIRRYAESSSADHVLMGYVAPTTDLSICSDYEVLKGHDTLNEQFLGNLIEYHTQGFFQVNHAISESMVAYVRNLFANELDSVQSTTELLDLYGGVASFGVSLAPLFDRLTVLESFAGSITSARTNLARSGRNEARALVDDAAEADRLQYNPELFVVTDPPRAGMQPNAIRRLISLAPRMIVYVSCNPEALAEEIPLFKGYRLSSVALFDMFPQTSHFEAVISLIRNEDGPERAVVPLVSNAGTTCLRIQCNPGLEDSLRKEIRELLPNAQILDNLSGLPGTLLLNLGTEESRQLLDSAPRFESETLAALRKLRTAHSILLHLDHFEIGRGTDTPTAIAARLDTLTVPGLSNAESFRVTTDRSGSHEFRSGDVERAVGAVMVQRHHKPVDLNAPELELRADVQDRHCLVSLSLPSPEPSGRAARVYQPRVTLNPTVAAAMLREGGVGLESGGKLLDPFCGSGTILMEAGLMYSNLELFGLDIDPTNAAGAQQNLEVVALESRSRVDRGDARAVSKRFERASIDLIATNPPFGVRLGKKTEFSSFYRNLLTEFATVLKPEGRVLILVGKKRYLFLEAIREQGVFRIVSSQIIETGGVFPELFILQSQP